LESEKKRLLAAPPSVPGLSFTSFGLRDLSSRKSEPVMLLFCTKGKLSRFFMKLQTFIFATMFVSLTGYAQTPMSSGDGPFQIRYASNISAGDSFINISNDGASMTVTTIAAGTNTLSVSGSICINAYAFDAAEEILSCCSCPVTPNGLVSLSVQRDLLNNTLTGRGTPSSIVIKLVATTPPVGGVGTASNPCGTSASTVTTNNLANGMVAWGTTLHANTSAAGTYALTETPFTVANPNPPELARLSQLCTFNQLQGSGFGICNSCEIGGLGAASSNQ
jgi:hypothetical protein